MSAEVNWTGKYITVLIPEVHGSEIDRSRLQSISECVFLKFKYRERVQPLRHSVTLRFRIKSQLVPFEHHQRIL